MLLRGFGWSCRLCEKETRVVELGEVLTERVVASGGTVETVEHGQTETWTALPWERFEIVLPS